MKYEYLTYEARNSGTAVHGWSTYPQYSVLAGQEMKCFLDSFPTVEDALKAYPSATASHSMLQAGNTFDHLSDKGDY